MMDRQKEEGPDTQSVFLCPCKLCGRTPEIMHYSGQYPFEQIVDIFCPKHRRGEKMILSLIHYGLSDDLEREAARLWNDGVRGGFEWVRGPLQEFKRVF